MHCVDWYPPGASSWRRTPQLLAASLTTFAHIVLVDDPVPFSFLTAPSHERDACGVGFIADINGNLTQKTIQDALDVSHCKLLLAPCAAGRGLGLLLAFV
jgi:hypothetical protein